MTYNEFLRTAKRLANRSDESWLALMQLLCKTEPKKDLWLAHYRKWSDLLETEGLCSAQHYRLFKLIQGELDPKDIKILGVYAAISIGRIPNKALRTEVLNKTLHWISKSKVRPTYQRISEYIKPHIKRDRATARFDYKKLYGEQQEAILILKSKLRAQAAYIRTLKAAMQKHGCPIPKNRGK